MSYNINLQHIIFRTNHSEKSIPQSSKTKLLAYITSVSRESGVAVIRINAHLNHVHVLVDLPVTMNISEYVRKIKQTSSAAFQGHTEFPNFHGWATGYGSFSVSYYERQHIVNYIKGQDEHHRTKTFIEELTDIFGKEFIEKDLYWSKNWID